MVYCGSHSLSKVQTYSLSWRCIVAEKPRDGSLRDIATLSHDSAMHLCQREILVDLHAG